MSDITKRIEKVEKLLDVNDWVPESDNPFGLTKDFLRRLRYSGEHNRYWKQINSRHTIWRRSYLFSLFQEQA